MATESIYRFNKLNKEESKRFIEAMEEAYELSLKHPLKPRPDLKTINGEEAAKRLLAKKRTTDSEPIKSSSLFPAFRVISINE